MNGIFAAIYTRISAIYRFSTYPHTCIYKPIRANNR